MSGRGPLAMVAGDFNVCGSEFGQRLDGLEEFRSLRLAMQFAGFPYELPLASERLGTLRVAPENELRCSPDHIFVTHSLNEQCVSAVVVDTRGRNGLMVSDHLALLVEFVL